MLHFLGLSVGTELKGVQGDLRMPDRRKEAIPLFWVLPFYGKSSRSSQDLRARVRSSEAE